MCQKRRRSASWIFVSVPGNLRYDYAIMEKQRPQHPSAQHTDTHFGFQTVAESEKAGKVAQVFHSVANNYDIMNDLMSGGLWLMRGNGYFVAQ